MSNEDQPRDDHGRFASGGGGGDSAKSVASQLAKAKFRVSKAANDTAPSARDKFSTAFDHQAKAREHMEAAKAHIAAGNKDKATEHLAQASKHMALASASAPKAPAPKAATGGEKFDVHAALTELHKGGRSTQEVAKDPRTSRLMRMGYADIRKGSDGKMEHYVTSVGHQRLANPNHPSDK